MITQLDAVEAAVPAESRGRTTIADRAVERIASQALTEVAMAADAPWRPLGIPMSLRSQGGVTAWVDGGLAIVNMRVSVVYPVSVREVSDRLREHVRTVVGRLTGLNVRQVDIEIARLVAPERHGGRVV